MPKGALIAALFVIAGIILYLLLGRGDVPESSPEAPAPTASEGPEASRPATGRGSDSEPEPTEDRVALRGQVQVQGGDPVDGAVVTLTPAQEDDEGSEPRGIVSGDGGRFAFTDLRPGRYTVSATRSGHLPAVERGLDVQADTSVTLVLVPGGHPLRGTVSDATGGAIEGALVRLTPLQGIAALRRLDGFGTLSTAEGAYELHVAPGRYRVDVSHPDYATDTRTVEVGPGAQSQDFELVPMGVIEGVVVRADGGAVVPHAWVGWQRERQRTMVAGHRMALVEGSGLVRADAQGRFVLRGLQPGAIGLRARASGAASEVPTVVPLAMAEHVTGVEVRVVQAHDLRGRVVAADDPEHGIAEAGVQLASNERDGPRATTDAQGRFVLRGVLAGSHTLVAHATGWRQPGPGVRVELGDRAPEPVVLTLERSPTIRGRVEPPTVAEVSVELRPETVHLGGGLLGGERALLVGGGGRTETGDDGRFELDAGQPGPTTVVARVADGRAGEVTVTVGPDGADDVVIRLEPRSTVRGEVRSVGGDPVAQATVVLRRAQAPGDPVVRLTINGRDMGVDMGTTTEDGRFEIGGVAAGDYEVEVTDRYGEPLPVQGGAEGRGRLAVREGEDVAGLVLTVDVHDGVITGIVRTADGEPVPDVWVQATLVPEDRPPSAPEKGGGTRHSEMRMVVDSGAGIGAQGRPPVLTDDEGRFEIGGLRDATYELEAESDGGRQRVFATASPGQDVVLQLAELGTIEGQITLDGQPLRSFSLRVEGPASRSLHVRDGGGHFEVGRLDPGAYRVVASTAEGSGSAQVTVAEGETVRQDLVLERLVKVTGRILDQAGSPVVGAMILLGEGADGRVSIERHDGEESNVTGEDGRFEVTCAPGPRALLAISPTSPEPMVVHFFVVKPGEDLDVGDLKEQPGSEGRAPDPPEP